jgi:hypothetical protein
MFGVAALIQQRRLRVFGGVDADEKGSLGMELAEVITKSALSGV